jgi:hypothetical protein
MPCSILTYPAKLRARERSVWSQLGKMSKARDALASGLCRCCRNAQRNMNRAHRLVLVGAISSTMVILFVAIVHHHKRKPEAARAQIREMFPVVADRLEKQTSKLAGESTAESIAKLSDVDLFYSPGPSMDQGMSDALPLPKDEGRLDLDAIMSNRRFRKVFEELSCMDKDAASEILRRALSAGTEEYLRLYSDKMKELAPPHTEASAGGKRGPVGPPVFVIGGVPEGKAVIAGSRLNVLALVWSCGMLNLTNCKAEVEGVARLALNQRTELYNAPTVGFPKRVMLRHASLYNRQIISSALLGVTTTDDAILRAVGIEWRVCSLTRFNSVVTEYDVPVHMGLSRPDFSQGTLKVRYVAPIDDVQFDKLLRSLRIPIE